MWEDFAVPEGYRLVQQNRYADAFATCLPFSKERSDFLSKLLDSCVPF